jgi:hypothetical protein
MIVVCNGLVFFSPDGNGKLFEKKRLFFFLKNNDQRKFVFWVKKMVFLAKTCSEQLEVASKYLT